jgi:hypothetical protein
MIVTSGDQAATVECSPSKRVDGKFHSWRWDGDDPRIICVYCGEMRDALTGRIIHLGSRQETDDAE